MKKNKYEKLNIQYFNDYAKERGGKCLTKTYNNLNGRLIFVCDKNHKWETNGKNVKYSNSWCPTCSGKQRLTIGEIKIDAIKKGGKCLSNEYVNSKSKLLFECEMGHQWYAKPDTIRNSKKWCPKCNCKDNIETYKKIAKERGGECLSNIYVDANKKLEFKCKCNHIWKTTGNSIKNLKSWCPKCGGTEKDNIETFKKIAKERGGKCLSKTYSGSYEKLKFQCNKGHIWETKPTNIKNKKNWCPICKESKGENIITNFLIKNKINFERQKTFKNCKNKNLLSFDFYLPQHNLLIEHDGEQHHKPIKFFGGEKRFHYTKICDNIKNEYCYKNNIHLLRINYDEDINSLLNKKIFN